LKKEPSKISVICRENGEKNDDFNSTDDNIVNKGELCKLFYGLWKYWF